MEAVKAVLLAVLKNVNWKKILVEVYRDAVRPELAKAVADSESKWDDLAYAAADYIVEKFLGDMEAEAAKTLKAVAAQPDPAPVPS